MTRPGRARRARGRAVVPLMGLALVVLPLVELYVLIQVGHVIGALPTVALLLAVSLLGAWLLRREGARTWRSFRSSTTAGRLPSKEVADGGLVMLGGALLLTPGFATDVFGLLMLLPPTRALLRRRLLTLALRRLGVPAPSRRHPSGSQVIDGEVLRPGQ